MPRPQQHQIQATSVTYTTAHSNTRSKPQCQILSPLNEARDRSCNLMDPSQIHFRCAMMGPPSLLFFLLHWLKVYQVCWSFQQTYFWFSAIFSIFHSLIHFSLLYSFYYFCSLASDLMTILMFGFLSLFCVCGVCVVSKYSVVFCHVLWYSMVSWWVLYFSVVSHDFLWCFISRYSVVFFRLLWYSLVAYGVLWYTTVLCSVLSCSLLFSEYLW